MTLYIAYCHDRHCDPEVFAFRSKEAAITKAIEYMRQSVAYPDDLFEEEMDGYVFRISYVESDVAWVKAVTLDEA